MEAVNGSEGPRYHAQKAIERLRLATRQHYVGKAINPVKLCAQMNTLQAQFSAILDVFCAGATEDGEPVNPALETRMHERVAARADELTASLESAPRIRVPT